MARFKKILVATDFSSGSRSAVLAAVELARQHEAQLTLLHVFEPAYYATADGYPFVTPDDVRRLIAKHTDALAVALREAQAAGASRVDSKLVQGAAASEVVAMAKSGGYDLIAIGTHGRTGLKHALLGSVAEKVVRHARCPVLVVPLAPADEPAAT